MNIFQEIENIINLDLNDRGIKHLHENTKFSSPCLEASEKITEALDEKNENVIITSGFPILPESKPETDGPPGVVVLAKALEKLESNAVLVSDKPFFKLFRELSDLINLDSIELENIPRDLEKAEEKCKFIIKKYDPQLLISIERPGLNEEGNYRNMGGKNITDIVGKVDILFRLAERENISTIGVGDGGNEIGMGNVRSVVKEKVSHGSDIASNTETDVLVTSCVSNWGSYGIVAALSILKDENLLHDSDLEGRLIDCCVNNGAVDSFSKMPKCRVDGIPLGVNESIVKILRFLVSKS